MPTPLNPAAVARNRGRRQPNWPSTADPKRYGLIIELHPTGLLISSTDDFEHAVHEFETHPLTRGKIAISLWEHDNDEKRLTQIAARSRPLCPIHEK